MPDRHVVIVGGSAAGLSTLEAMRSAGAGDAVTVVRRESHLPYERPPLSKQVLAGSWGLDQTLQRSAEEIAALQAEWRLSTSAVSLDVDRRVVGLDDGTDLAFDELVISTGLTPRRLPGTEGFDRVVTLRTWEDATALRALLPGCDRIGVVGAGFLGTEVAAVARELGCTVHLIDMESLPLIALGQELGRAVEALHRRHGTQLHLGVGGASLRQLGSGSVAVELGDGGVLTLDLVVVAIGAAPEVEWLRTSGLSLSDGVDCDENGRARDGIWAVGDVANWFEPLLGRRVRFEHRNNASAQGLHVAHSILGIEPPPRPVPYAWTNQFDARVQIFGHPAPVHHVVVSESGEGGRLVLEYRDTAGILRGGVAWNLPAAGMRIRRELTEGSMVTG